MTFRLIFIALLVIATGTTCANDDDDSNGEEIPEGMVLIPPGVFMMGSPESEVGRKENERQHEVTISRPFWLDATEITQEEYLERMGSNPSSFSDCGSGCPVEMVTWLDAVAFCNARSAAHGLATCYAIDGESVEWDRDCAGYRLPTEAEWEYAARAGARTAFANGEISTEDCGDPVLDEVAHYCVGGTRAVGLLAPNAWGLLDIHGNVAEWVWDWYDGPYTVDAVTDPIGSSQGEFRLDRGGSWLVRPPNCRAAYRDDDHKPVQSFGFIGFRVARSAKE